ncbi:hypothetical protein EW145_g5019 [Phellinidium pouzarii]|uniref:Pre-mRNA-processing factor 19 n=1 Tax=Phellinidium pouzarii TaxID=167371 RepID=A0A4S4L6C3_9AGAM|nr:hypothetical protein EW145_g5019 [Phellinidium pouzarii]
MSFFCALSGEPPQDPVVSVKSGHVYERRLITKYITDNGSDPITGDKLEEADLVSVKANPKTAPPRSPSMTSIPTLLHTLQNEWDALVLETFVLKQQYNSVRQQLSHALYAQDSATRVVARLIKERDSAREALANVQATIGITAAPQGGDVEMGDQAAEERPGLPKEIVAQIDETNSVLSATRRKRKPAAEHATQAQVKTFTATHTVPSLHSASPSGITSLALSRTQQDLFATGGNDKIVQLYDRGQDKVITSLKGHTKRIHHVALREASGAPTLVLSASADKTARVWSHDATSGEYVPRQTVKLHKGEVTGLFVHPTSTLMGLASLDRTYSVHDLTNFTPVFQSAAGEDVYTSVSIHPDGTLLALGTSGSTIQIFDIRSGALAATLAPEDTTPFTVSTLAFSENGYHLLAPDSTSSLAIWDLRKQARGASINLGENFKVNKVTYDVSAQFFGVAGNEGGRAYAHKSWEELARFEEGGEMSDIVFGDLGKEVWGTFFSLRPENAGISIQSHAQVSATHVCTPPKHIQTPVDTKCWRRLPARSAPPLARRLGATHQPSRPSTRTPPTRLHSPSRRRHLPRCRAELSAIAASLKETPALSSFVANPLLSSNERAAGIEVLLRVGQKGAKEPVSDVTKNLFAILSENGRLSETPSVIEGFDELVAKYKGELEIIVTSAAPLPKEVLSRLESTLKQSEAEQVNPSVLGGIVVDVGDKTIDLSVASRVTKLNSLIQQSV